MRKVLSGGTLQISSIDGDVSPEVVNIGSVNCVMFKCPLSVVV